MTDQVAVSLKNTQEDMWHLFHGQTNEMIVTKSGRKMFPKLEYMIKGLMPDKLYALMLHIEPVDESRYKFSNGEWAKSGKAEKHAEPKKVWHADGVMSGKQWMLNSIHFDRVKITNNADATNASLVFLHSMHKYVPVLSIYESPTESPICVPQPSTRLVSVTRLPHTEFIAVTAYQNDAVIKLKIEYNPFAKGFREGSQTERKRKSPSRGDSTPEDVCSQVSSPQPKKTRLSVSPPTLPHFPPAMFPPSPAMNPMLFNPLFYQMMSANLPQFPFGFPFYSQVAFPAAPFQEAKIEHKKEVEVKKEEVEPEVNVV